MKPNREPTDAEQHFLAYFRQSVADRTWRYGFFLSAAAPLGWCLGAPVASYYLMMGAGIFGVISSYVLSFGNRRTQRQELAVGG